MRKLKYAARKILTLLLAMALTAAVGCGSPSDQSSTAEETTQNSSQSAPSQEEETNLQPQTQKIVLMAAGDNLIHDVIYHQANRRTGGAGYDFAPAYARIAPLLEEADFAFINQETLLAGEEMEPSSYPLFCSPVEVGEEMIRLGFNLFSTANNHCFDKGEAGLQASARFWEKHPEVAAAGSYADAVQKERLNLVTRGDITVALVAATELTNGLTMPSGSEAGVLLLSDMEEIRRQLAEASQQADLVILSLHWGAEDASVPTENQRELAQELAEAGADIILGHHSHVLQGGEFVETSRGRSYVAYSLGNFISAQIGAQNMLAGLLRIEMTCGGGNAPVIEKVELIPTVTHYGSGFSQLEIWPLADYTPEMAASHGILQHDARFGWEYLQQQLQSLNFGTNSQDSSTATEKVPS